jgi:peptidoglycan/xylan/chitin deacetylase (PgdA/CDA1 family)
MYHGFTPGLWGAIDPSHLRLQLEYMAREHEVVPVMELVRRLQDGRDSERAIALTFDDGYLDFATVAYPILRELALPASLYVPTAFIGGMNEWESDAIPRVPLLDDQALRSFDPSLVTVGSHTVHHRALTGLSADDLTRELVLSRDRLEQIVGRPVHELAYPFGHHGTFDDVTRAAAASAGYKVALTTCWSTWASSKDLQAMPRIHLTGVRDELKTRAVLRGHSDWRGVREALVAGIRAR